MLVLFVRVIRESCCNGYLDMNKETVKSIFQVKSILLANAAVMALFAFSDAYAQDGGVFAPAPATAQNAPTFMESLMSMLPMLAICYMIFYFMVLRPQETKVKKHKQLLESLKRGDSVVTTGGLIGRVNSVEKGVVNLEIAPNVKIRVEESHVLRFEKDGSSAEAA